MTFDEIIQTANEMQCMLKKEDSGYTLYLYGYGYLKTVMWVLPNAFNGAGAVSSTYHFPQKRQS